MGLEEKTQSRVIDGVLYETTPLAFGVGNKALLRFMRLATPVMARLLGGKSNGNTVQAAAAAALVALPDVLSDEDVDYFAKVFGSSSRYQNGDKMTPLIDANREANFAGKYMAFYEWLAFCIEVNFSSFFGDLTKRLGQDGPAEKAIA